MLLSPLAYRVINTAKVILVPAGFVTDFASIPQLFRNIISGQDDTRKPAVVHDFLYRKKLGDRKTADRIFLQAMQECEVAWWKRRLAWAAVRAAGWIFWRAE